MNARKLFFVLALAAAMSVQANTFYAAPEAKTDPSDPNYCMLPECAGTLQDAVYMATNDCDFTEVVLADGTYHADWDMEGLAIELIDSHPGGFFTEKSYVHFTNLTVRSSSGDPKRCVIDGGGSNDRHRCFYIESSCHRGLDGFDTVVAKFTVKGITFQNFCLDIDYSSSIIKQWRGLKGAAICVSSDMDLEVDDCIFENCISGRLGGSTNWDGNSGKCAGGAIYAEGSSVSDPASPFIFDFTLNRSSFRECHSTGTGAAICSWKRTRISDCTFEGCISSNSVSDVSYYAGTVSCHASNRDPACLNISWASNCVFRDNYCYSAREVRGGAVHNMNTYRCKFYSNGCHGSAGGWGGTIWGYNDLDKFVHIEDEVDNSDRPPEWSFHQSELRGGRYYRCRFGGSNRVEAVQSTLSGNLSSFYNCLFQDFYYYNYKPTRAINCTFARCRWGNHSWNGFFMEKGEMINSAMLDCESMNGCIVEYTTRFNYTSGAIAMSNSVYYAGSAERIHPDWGEKGNNTWYRPGDKGATDGTQYYSYLNPASSTDPYRPARDCYLVDRGIKLEGMDAKGDLMARDLLGNPRCVGGAPDIGCYEYYVKPGISVMLR